MKSSKERGARMMKVMVNGRNLKITDAMNDYVNKKVEKFEKMFRDDVEVVVTFSTQRNSHVVEITIPLKQGAVLRAEARGDDMYSSIDDATEKITRQIRKHKTKLEKRFQSNNSIRFEEVPDWAEPVEEQLVVKTKKYDLRPMTVEEAQLQLELIGHDFFVFVNADNDQVNVIYKRKDQQYGLLEPNR